ncbi:MAG: hypothetical protein JWM95_1572 [Gemmatimonadetes bacterium]|nr:hypothetical protein [Gemmatimonadota bacterium]
MTTPPAPTPAPNAVGIKAHVHTKYKFEVLADRNSRRASDATDKDFENLVNNLGLTILEVDALGLKPLLLDFTIHHQCNIDWYEKRIKNEESAQRRFFWFTIMAAAAIPVVTFALTKYSEKSTTIAQLSSVLAGILGFQSALKSFFDKRNIIAIFHKASAALKKTLFGFEDRWSSRVPGSGSSVQDQEIFKANLRNAIRKARDIEAEEEDAYFEKAAGYPVLDLTTLLTQSSSAAATLASRFGVTRDLPAAPAALAAAQGTPAKSVDILAAKLNVLRSNLDRTTDPEQRKIIESEFAIAKQQLDDAQQALMHSAMRQFDTLG